MLKASEKEYEMLKKEISELRSCITNYNGYIISVFGASGLLLKVLIEENYSPISILLLTALTMLVVTLVFDVIWYKFKSHNRYVGYIQLMSQEVSHHTLERNHQVLQDKNYLDLFQDPNHSKFIPQEGWNLFTWEFIMSRYNNASFHQVQNRLIKATNKTRFVFKLPSSYSYNSFSTYDQDYKDLDSSFFENIVHKIYRVDEEHKSIPTRLFRSIINFFSIFKLVAFLYSPIYSDSIRVSKKIDIDDKYFSSGWLYPKKITQIAFIPISLFFLGFFFILFQHFSFVPPNGLKNIEQIYPTALAILVISVYVYWIKRYLLGLSRIINGEGSIEFYCWTFFLFRVQLLNANGIVPVYFSRGFIRYFKSKLIRHHIEKNKNEFITDTSNCIACDPKSLFGNPSIGYERQILFDTALDFSP